MAEKAPTLNEVMDLVEKEASEKEVNIVKKLGSKSIPRPTCGWGDQKADEVSFFNDFRLAHKSITGKDISYAFMAQNGREFKRSLTAIISRYAIIAKARGFKLEN